MQSLSPDPYNTGAKQRRLNRGAKHSLQSCVGGSTPQAPAK